MASSAFKSTSKRSCDVSPPVNKTRGRNAPVRRTRSRSVVSRADDDINQFSNKRDNPLFSSTHDETDESSRSNLNGRRFRSLSRNPSPRSRNAEETETDQECSTKELLIQSNSMRRNTFCSVESSKTWSSVHPIREPSDGLASVCSPVPNWDDGGSGIYFSEAEEQTINEFTQCILSLEDEDEASSSSRVLETGRAEKMRPICDIQSDMENEGTYSTTTNVNFSHSTRDPGPVELVLDIRREYVKELELSEERARKLRADLAAEEHYGVELGRVLKELLPDSRVDNSQRRRFPKKNSSERRRMSKRLTDEALAYFDECISISTFDNSDVSSPEDPRLNLQASAPYVSTKSIARGCSTVGTSCTNSSASSLYQDSRGDDAQNQVSPSITASNNNNCVVQPGPSSTFNSKSYNTRQRLSRVQENIRNVSTYKENETHGCCEAHTIERQIDMEDYNFLAKAESLLLDKVLMKNRSNNSGSVAVCEGTAFCASSFIF